MKSTLTKYRIRFWNCELHNVMWLQWYPQRHLPTIAVWMQITKLWSTSQRHS